MRSRMRGFGLLPDFSPNGDGLVANFVSQLNSAIAQAQSDQATIAPLLTRPEGASLAAIVAGLESSVSAAWANVQDMGRRVAAAQQAQQAAMAVPKPSQADFQYSGGAGWYQAAVDAWTKNVQKATTDVGSAQGYAAQARDDLKSLLVQYNDKVLAAAKLVQAVVDANLKAQAAHTDVATAADARQASNLQTQAFVADQQLAQIKAQSAAATAAVAQPSGPNPLIIAAVAVPVLGIIAWALTRKKSGAVAGYRRRRRSRR